MGDETSPSGLQLDNGRVNPAYQSDTSPDKVLEIPDMVGLPSAEMVDESVQTRAPRQGAIHKFQDTMDNFFHKYGGLLGKLVVVLLLVGYTVYFVFALVYRMDDSTTVLIVLTSLTVFFIIYGYLRDRFGERVYDTAVSPIETFLTSKWYIIKW